jgi:SAM-dependent methyltransferase
MNRTIAPDDHMLQGGEDAYFRTAEAGRRAVLAGVYGAGRDPVEIHHVLDFGSGYGRVYRALAEGFPDAILTACDLMEPAARFCAQTFGGNWAKGNEDLSLIQLPVRYDLIWLGSVFTHLPEGRWTDLLSFLSERTKPRGVIVFTTHGARAIQVHEEFALKRNPNLIPRDTFEWIKAEVDRSGFAFASTQPGTLQSINDRGIDVSEGEYGFSFTSESWVRTAIGALPELRFVSYVQGGWGNNHDVVSVQRLPPGAVPAR